MGKVLLDVEEDDVRQELALLEAQDDVAQEEGLPAPSTACSPTRPARPAPEEETLVVELLFGATVGVVSEEDVDVVEDAAMLVPMAELGARERDPTGRSLTVVPRP